MAKNIKTQDKSLILIILAVITTMVVSVGLTFAYFTSRLTNNATTLNFGHLEVVNEVTSQATDVPLIPGTTINFGGDIGLADSTNIDALLRMKFNISVTGGSAPAVAKEKLKTELINALFGTNKMWLYPMTTGENPTPIGSYLYYAGKFVPEGSENFGGNNITTYTFENRSFTLDRELFGDEFQDVQVTLSITVQAIQAKYVGLDNTSFALSINDTEAEGYGAERQTLVNNIFTATTSIWASLFPVEIMLNENGGTAGSTSAEVSLNAGTLKAPISTLPTKEGYTFTGWYTAPEEGTMVIDSTGALQPSVAGYTNASHEWINEEPATLYAQWSAMSYLVTFNKQDGTNGTDEVNATYDSAMPTGLTAPTKAGYNFAGYYSEENGQGTQYFNASMESTNVWNIAQATTLYAYWTAGTYTVTLNANGGTGGTASVQATYNSAMPSGATAPTRTGYTFGGYFANNNSTGTQYYTSGMVSASNWTTGNAGEIYAGWTADNYTITLNTNGGAIASGWTGSPSTYTKGYTIESSTVTLPTPTKNGYTFDAWYDNNGLTGTAVTQVASASTGNKVFYAKFTATNYTITLNANEGTISTAGWTLANGVYTLSYTIASSTITLPEPNKNSSTFGGWYDNSGLTGTAVTQVASGSTGDKTFYAKWSLPAVRITLNANTGTGGDEYVDAQVGHKLEHFNRPYKDGYSIEGWYTASTGGTRIIDSAYGLIPSVTGYTDGSCNWIRETATTLYAHYIEWEGGSFFQLYADYDYYTEEYSLYGFIVIYAGGVLPEYVYINPIDYIVYYLDDLNIEYDTDNYGSFEEYLDADYDGSFEEYLDENYNSIDAFLNEYDYDSFEHFVSDKGATEIDYSFNYSEGSRKAYIKCFRFDSSYNDDSPFNVYIPYSGYNSLCGDDVALNFYDTNVIGEIVFCDSFSGSSLGGAPTDRIIIETGCEEIVGTIYTTDFNTSITFYSDDPTHTPIIGFCDDDELASKHIYVPAGSVQAYINYFASYYQQYCEEYEKEYDVSVLENLIVAIPTTNP